MVNVIERWAKYFPDQVIAIANALGFVPKLHIEGHIEDCQFLFSLLLAEFIAQTCGESIERTWSVTKAAAKYTAEMTQGNRQDTLNDVFHHFNWTKFAKMGE